VDILTCLCFLGESRDALSFVELKITTSLDDQPGASSSSSSSSSSIYYYYYGYLSITWPEKSDN
jgi:hypothetical protein